jgi:hypothetical protein
MGSCTADLAGLHRYTVTTNLVNGLQSKKTNIGDHYVATDSNGLHLDYDGDGFPDHPEDANGNGVPNPGGTNWQSYNSPNGFASPTDLRVYAPLK